MQTFIKVTVRGKIAALLQAFGLSVGSCGLANVLQCAVGLSRCVFFFSFLNHITNYHRSGFNLFVKIHRLQKL